MKKSTLLTSNGLEIDCLIVDRKPLISGGEEALVYIQNRLVKGYIKDDDDYVAEISIFVNWCIIPEFEEELLCSEL